MGAVSSVDLPAEAALVFANTGLAVLRAEGADAGDFLDSLCTVRLADAGEGEVRLGAFADPRGRVLALFRAWRQGNDWRLAVPDTEAEWLRAHLSRYVLRARVRLFVADSWTIAGVAGRKIARALTAIDLPVPAEGRVERSDAVELVGLPSNRWLMAGPQLPVRQAIEALNTRAKPARRDAWQDLRFANSEPEIRGPTRARYLPQMLGLVELGAVQFDKGCYPGQEIIARSEHLGRVKRRLVHFDWHGVVPRSGAPLPLGDQALEVLDSARTASGQWRIQAIAPWPPSEELRLMLERSARMPVAAGTSDDSR